MLRHLLADSKRAHAFVDVLLYNRQQYEYLANFKVLQNTFKKHSIDKVRVDSSSNEFQTSRLPLSSRNNEGNSNASDTDVVNIVASGRNSSFLPAPALTQCTCPCSPFQSIVS